MGKGLFVVFEGIDGSGKGTIISGVKKALVEAGVGEPRLLLTAEPTNGFYGKKVRELLKTNVNPDVNAHQFLDLYVADRREHIRDALAPAIEGGKIILCDRYKYSTFVYQSLQGISLEKIRSLHEGMPVPDLVFVLDVPVETALERIATDSKRKRLESFEKKEFLRMVREGFASLKKVFPKENIIFVDASKPVHGVKESILKTIFERL